MIIESSYRCKERRHVDTVAAYFDEKASMWEEMEKHTKSTVQAAVAVMAGVVEGSRVLDLGCGLGVMIPVYLQLDAAHILGVDISQKMIRKAQERWADYPNIEFDAIDACMLTGESRFDSIVIYNAYPHFMNRPALVETCARLLVKEGRFCIAHGTGRNGINSHHDAVAAGVSLGLKKAREESAIWQKLFEIDAIVDTPGFYAFAGQLK